VGPCHRRRRRSGLRGDPRERTGGAGDGASGKGN
jgi:hypothetical protein